MKILSIGNSFSIDAHAFLHTLSEQHGENLSMVNLAIGGCSLKTHWENVVGNNANYLHIVNGGEPSEQLVAIEEVLKAERFDVVTLQQVSHFSGKYETYQPYLNDLISYVRSFQPSADFYFHRTWAYEIDSAHGDFTLYDRDQKQMYKEICQVTEKVCLETGLTVIPSGDVIQAMRERIDIFDYKNGGESLCCDGFHLSHTYGRYAAALTWLATITGKRVKPLPFKELSTDITTKICDIVNEIVFDK